MKDDWKFEKKIGNMKNLKIVEYIDLADSGEKRWTIEDEFGNRTPMFENEINISLINENSLLVAGRVNGFNNLYFVSSDSKNGLDYKLLINDNVKSIINIDSNHILINSREGKYFFNKNELKQESDIFTKLYRNEDKWVFEKEYEIDNNKLTIIGNVTLEGKIMPVGYEYETGIMVFVPLDSYNKESYDKINNNIMNNELAARVEHSKKVNNNELNKVITMNYGK